MVVGSLPLRAIHVPCTRFPEPGHPMPFSPCRPATHSNSKRKHDAYCNLVQHVECRGRRPIYCRKNFIIWGGDGKRICMTRTTAGIASISSNHSYSTIHPQTVTSVAQTVTSVVQTVTSVAQTVTSAGKTVASASKPASAPLRPINSFFLRQSEGNIKSNFPSESAVTSTTRGDFEPLYLVGPIGTVSSISPSSP